MYACMYVCIKCIFVWLCVHGYVVVCRYCNGGTALKHFCNRIVLLFGFQILQCLFSEPEYVSKYMRNSTVLLGKVDVKMYYFQP